MNRLDELDRTGAELLARLAAGGGDKCARDFDALLYEFVWRFLRRERDALTARVARFLKLEGLPAPSVLPEEVDEVAHDATTLALRRVRQKAARFDPRRGTVTDWACGAATWAWIEVAKETVKARRGAKLEFVDPADLVEHPDAFPTTEEHVLGKIADEEALAEAATHLSEKEFTVLRLIYTSGYSYAEAAEAMFGDGSATKQIDGLLTRAKAKLARAWADRRAAPQPGARTNVLDPGDDEEGRNE